MQLRNRSFLLSMGTALLAFALGATDTMAGPVLVSEAEGTFDFVLTANGTGNISITYTFGLLTKVNSLEILTGPITSQVVVGDESLTVTSSNTVPPVTFYSLTDIAAGVQSLGVGAGSIDTATLPYRITSGLAIDSSFLNLTGDITGVNSPFLETTATSPTVYDFTPFAVGGLLTLTYTKVGADFASVIANGGTITGTGGFTEIAGAVPEPNSIVLLAVGVSGLFASRRYIKRTTSA